MSYDEDVVDVPRDLFFSVMTALKEKRKKNKTNVKCHKDLAYILSDVE
jgi:hypothetical protein